jgi:2-keto-4-pentenoate hydratase/2-oxohepta-3-ene-1,7-dioic acid hydratase in catechol pathway
MKLIRYRLGKQTDYGLIVDGAVHSLQDGLWAPWQPGPAVAGIDEVVLLAPCEPSKIVAVGRNYAAHAAEHGADVPSEPLIFLKPPSAVIGPGEPIVYPARLSQHVEHEAELAVVIGRRARHVPRDEAFSFVLGYTCGNDVTARDLQRRDGQWSRAKGFDTFCPLGPWIETDLDITDLGVRGWVNGQLQQDGRTKDLVFPLDELIAYATAVMTLEPGDVILTGTPAGVSPLQPGDRVAVEVEGIGVLENDVVGPE